MCCHIKVLTDRRVVQNTTYFLIFEVYGLKCDYHLHSPERNDKSEAWFHAVIQLMWWDLTFFYVRWRDLSFLNIRWRDFVFFNIRWRDLVFFKIRWWDLTFYNIRWRNLTFSTLCDGIWHLSTLGDGSWRFLIAGVGIWHFSKLDDRIELFLKVIWWELTIFKLDDRI